MDWKHRTGYSQLKDDLDNSSQTNKEDKEFIKQRAVEVNGWLSSITTLHLTQALNKEIERLIEQLKKCDGEAKFKYIQGSIDGVETVLARINALSEVTKKIVKEA